MLNLDQTPSKYIPVFNKTLAAKGSKTVPVMGSTEKRMIKATFKITLDDSFFCQYSLYIGVTLKKFPQE